jgi:glutamate--cysteine ligase
MQISQSLSAIVPRIPQEGPAQLGLEVEMFGFDAKTFQPLGAPGSSLRSEQLLQRIQQAHPDSHLKVDKPTGVIIGLELPCGNFSLEPGGQLEYATCPKNSMAELAKDFHDGLLWLEEAGRGEVLFLDHGTNPVAGPDLGLLVPKQRYQIMTRYFGSLAGGRGVDMMRYSATAQPNIDVIGADNWLDAVNLTFALTPFVRHLFANSRYFHGKLTPPGSERQRIWTRVDPSRTGIPGGVVLAKDLPRAYADWGRAAFVFQVLALPVEEQPLHGELTFSQWEEHGYKGVHPTETDWVSHLGTLFPDLRLRRFLEVRMVDAQSFEHALAPIAFWAAALQHCEARAKLWAIVNAAKNELGSLTLPDFLELSDDHEVFRRPRVLKALLDTACAESRDELSEQSLRAYGEWLEIRDCQHYPKSGLDFVRELGTHHPARKLNLSLH